MNENKPEWLDRVKKTYYFHVARLRENPKHTITLTAKELNRPIGPVSEELKVAQWLKTHSHKLKEFEYLGEAVEWIRSQKHKFLEIDDL